MRLVEVPAREHVREQDPARPQWRCQLADRRPVEVQRRRRGTGPGPNDTSARSVSPGRMSGAMSTARPQSPL